MAQQFKVGDKFTVDPTLFPASCHGVVYTVTRVPTGRREVNYKGAPASGEGRGVRSPEYAMRPFDGTEQPAPTVTTYVPTPDAGTVVAVKADAPATSRIDRSALFVVMGEARNRNGEVKLVRLGGDGGRYWPHFPMRWLDVVPVGDVAARLAS